MGRALKSVSPDHAGAVATDHAVRRPAAAGVVDRSARGADMRALKQLMQNGPVAVAQRRLLHSLFGSAAQREALPEGEKPKVKPATPAVQHATAPRANDTGLPDPLKSGVEALSGVSMDGVRVHYNSPQPTQLNALAYAQGRDIHLGPGQEQHLPHEAWHLVQQAQGRVKPTVQMKDGVSVNDDAGLEREADVMGARALASTAPLQLASWERSSEAQTKPTYPDRNPNSAVVQRLVGFEFETAWILDRTGPRRSGGEEAGTQSRRSHLQPWRPMETDRGRSAGEGENRRRVQDTCGRRD